MGKRRSSSGRPSEVSEGPEVLPLRDLLPPSVTPEMADVACRLMSRAEAMGVLADPGSAQYSHDLLHAALEGFARYGVGRRIVEIADVEQDLRRALEVLNGEVEQSPIPSAEWPSLIETLGASTLANYVGVSETSVHRYAAGSRSTPDDVAARLHWLALVIADLAGSYNDFGIRRWFTRRRHLLGDRSPSDILTDTWEPGDEDVESVAELARALTAPFAS